MRTCQIDGCDRPVKARALCNRHYQSERIAGRLTVRRYKSRGGVREATNGYLYRFDPTHPLAHRDGYVAEHRLVAWEAGLLTDPTHHVHHINGHKKDNRLANLEVMAAVDHHQHHIAESGEVVNQYGVHPLQRNRELGVCPVCGDKAVRTWVRSGNGHRQQTCSRSCGATWRRQKP